MSTTASHPAFRPGRAFRSAVRAPRVALARVWISQLQRAPAAARLPTVRVRPRTAYAVVFGLWGIYFGAGVVNAVRVVVGDAGPAPDPITLGEAILNTVESLAATGSCIWLVYLLAGHYGFTRDQMGWTSRRRRPRRVGTSDAFRLALLYTFIVAYMFLILGALQPFVGGAGFPNRPPGGWPGVINATASSINAGVIEELVLVALLVTTLEAARQPAWAIYTVAIGVRVSFHLYYGGQDPAGLISVTPMLAWAAAAVALFRWTRMVLPLIVVHILWDLRVEVAYSAGPQWGPIVNASAFFLLGVGAFIYTLGCWTRQRRAARAQLEPLLVDTADRFHVPPPRLRMKGRNPPELFRGRRGPTLHYNWRQARRHTEEQRRGLVAHSIAHEKLGHPLSSHTQRIAMVCGVSAATAALASLFADHGPWAMPYWVGGTALTVASVLCLVAVVDLTRACWRWVHARDNRLAREIDADVTAAGVVGPGAVLAAIATPSAYPSQPSPTKNFHLSPRAQRRSAVVSYIEHATDSPRP